MNNFIRKYANIPNPITNFFNKIYSALLCEDDYREEIEWLEAMKKVPLYVECIKISSNNTEQLEKITDPKLHNTPINILELTLDENFNFSSKTIENLKAIYPNSITLNYRHFSIYTTANQILIGNFTKLLSKLDQTSLLSTFYGEFFDLELEFSDVIFKVVESNEECSYIKAKSVEIRWTAEDFCWIK